MIIDFRLLTAPVGAVNNFILRGDKNKSRKPGECFSVDTSAFYTDQEKEVQKEIYQLNFEETWIQKNPTED